MIYASSPSSAASRQPRVPNSLRSTLGNGAHTQNVAHALRGRNHAARVKQVEGMRTLQHVVIRGKRQAGGQHAVALGFIAIEFAEQHVGVGNLEVVRRELALVSKNTSP